MAPNFPKQMKTINSQIQDSVNPKNKKYKEIPLRHIIIRLFKMNDQEDTRKAGREKSH